MSLQGAGVIADDVSAIQAPLGCIVGISKMQALAGGDRRHFLLGG